MMKKNWEVIQRLFSFFTPFLFFFFFFPNNYRLTRDRTSFATTLDILKFICKEVWTAIWDKQVDNLRTNHRGVYVLQDNVFKPLLRLSLANSPAAAKELATISKVQLAFPVGIIRGALSRLGVSSTVVAETTQIPQCENLIPLTLSLVNCPDHIIFPLFMQAHFM